jgi:hypothetical protein
MRRDEDGMSSHACTRLISCVTQIENVQPRPRVMYAHNPSI